MIGRVMAEVTGGVGDDEMVFLADDMSSFRFHYEADCASCEINDIAGDLADLCGTPILRAELVSSDRGEGERPSEDADSWTWSFYKFRTMKGDVTVRWLGQSNGYYSETVTFTESVTEQIVMES